MILGEEVEVVEVLPNESDRIKEDGSRLLCEIKSVKEVDPNEVDALKKLTI